MTAYKHTHMYIYAQRDWGSPHDTDILAYMHTYTKTLENTRVSFSLVDGFTKQRSMGWCHLRGGFVKLLSGWFHLRGSFTQTTI